MGVKAKLGAGVWDLLLCQDCGYSWPAPDVDLEWTDDPEHNHADQCCWCGSVQVIREERG